MARATRPPRCLTPPRRCPIYLQQMGITLPATANTNNLQLKNVAAVIVTAELPAFAQPGQQIDINVSSMGNAKSLKGGTLITTRCAAPMAQIYALAQGNLVMVAPGRIAGRLQGPDQPPECRRASRRVRRSNGPCPHPSMTATPSSWASTPPTSRPPARWSRPSTAAMAWARPWPWTAAPWKCARP